MEDISDFELLIKKELGLAGLNVTVPYKQKIIPYLDALAETARTIQAVNTICFCRKKGVKALVGHNTDVIGFERSLKEHLHSHHSSALVLGTGGSSKAVVYVLEKLGIEFQLVSRNQGEGRLTYAQLDNRLVEKSPIIINTTPLGMFPEINSYPEIPFDSISPRHLLFDLVYNPEKTRFLSLGDEKGASTVNGYDMLVYQAEASWEIWNKKV